MCDDLGIKLRTAEIIDDIDDLQNKEDDDENSKLDLYDGYEIRRDKVKSLIEVNKIDANIVNDNKAKSSDEYNLKEINEEIN